MRLIKEGVKHTLWGIHRLLTRRSLARLRVRKGLAKGTLMDLDLRREGSYWLGTYDEWVLNRVKLEKWIKRGQTAWDCGAYIGYYTAIFRHLVAEQGKVITFEGSSVNYRRVAALPEINGWTNVEVRRQAIGPCHSVIKFASNLGGSSGPYGLSKQYEAGTNIDVEEVSCAGVDELVYEQAVSAPDFIKFDLESAEEFALHNGPQLFSAKQPLLLLELHGAAAKSAAGRFLETYNYAAWDVLQLLAGTPPLRSNDDFQTRPPESHMLFCLPNGRADEIRVCRK